MIIGTSLLAIALIVATLIFLRKKNKRVKKYPQYPGIDDEYVDALTDLADNKVNRRFLIG